MTRKLEPADVTEFPYGKRLFDALPIGVTIHGPDGRVLSANPAAESILGVTLDELLALEPGDSRWATLREDGSAMPVEERPLARVLASGQPVQAAVLAVVRQHDGERCWLRVSATPLHFTLSAAEIAVCQTFIDISRERAQGERLALWGRAFELAELALAMGDFESGCLISANPCFARQRAQAAEDLAGRPFLGLFPPDQHALVAEQLSSLLAGSHVVFNAEHLRADGSRFPVAVDLTLLRGADGTPAQWIACVLDLTERQRLEADRQHSEDRYRALVQQAAADAIFVHDHLGRFREVNVLACASVGYSEAELLSMQVTDLEQDFDLAAAQAAWARIEPDTTTVLQGHHRRKDGSVFPVEVRFGLLQAEPERLYMGVVRGSAAQPRAAEFLRLAEHAWESHQEAILITDGQGAVIDINAAFTRITGYALAELAGSRAWFEQSFGSSQWIGQEFRRSIEHFGRWQGELWDRRKDGRPFAKSVSVAALRDAGGQIFRYVVHFCDISERRLREGLLRRQQDTDALTGLPGRMAFAALFNDELQRAFSEGRELALLCFDLDHFKDLNASLGVARGDRILCEVARRLRSAVRAGDLVARLGNDEFAVVLCDFGSPEVVERMAQALLKAVAGGLELDEETVEVSASLGMALFPGDGETVESLLHCADQAMARARRRGRSHFAWFTESSQRATLHRLRMLTDLRHAVARDELVLHYQPIVDLATGAIVKVEALVRWQHPQRGLVMPGDFIVLAEDKKEKDLIVEIGEWVAETALHTALRLSTRFGRLIPITVNHSPGQFAEGTPPLAWPARLQSLGLPGAAVVVEITEGVAMDSDPVVGQRLLQLRELGVPLALDDFGAGFCSFRYLLRSDVEFIKIDREVFIARLLDDHRTQAAVRAIIQMARELGIRTVAEGIETEAQAGWLRSHGCDLGQGWLFSRALAPDALEDLIARQDAMPPAWH